MIFSSLARSQSALQCLQLSRFSMGPKFAKTRNSSQQQLGSLPVRFLSGVTFSAALAHKTLKVNVAECVARTTQVSDEKRNETKKSSVRDLLSYILKEEWFPLLIAVASAVMTAFCHALMPICMGDVFPVLRTLLCSGTLVLENIQAPATRLAVLCLAQSIFTAIYISALAIVFKSASTRLEQAQVMKSIKAGTRKNKN